MNEPAIVSTDPARGRLFTLAIPPLGALLWAAIWHFGFIASIVAWLIAAGTIRLYRKGAGGLTRADVPWIISVIVFSIALAFLAGMTGDAIGAYAEQVEAAGTWATLTKADFWNYFLGNLLSPDVWSSYAGDLAIAAAFGALGSFSDIKQLYADTKPTAGNPPEDNPTPASTN